MIQNVPWKRRLPWIGLLLAGLAARWAFVALTRADAPHPDLGSFQPAAVGWTHPFDTSPREPAFVWWLWSLERIGLSSTPGTRAAGALLFLLNGSLFIVLARRTLGDRWAGPAVILYAFLPAQIQADSLGLRHLFETTGVLVLLLALLEDGGLERPRSFWAAAIAVAGLTLLRISHLAGGGLLLAVQTIRRRSFRPLLALAPALIAVLPHLYNNRARHQDPFYSINLHTYWYSNLEYIGQPGFPPTYDAWQADAYRPSLTYREWVWKRHRPWEVVRDTGIGYLRQFWTFPQQVYFKFGIPSALRPVLLGLLVLGYLLALRWKTGRGILAALICLGYPFAFVGHVFWAGRFFVPFSPLVLLLLVGGLQRVWTDAMPVWSRLRASCKTPEPRL